MQVGVIEMKAKSLCINQTTFLNNKGMDKRVEDEKFGLLLLFLYMMILLNQCGLRKNELLFISALFLSSLTGFLIPCLFFFFTKTALRLLGELVNSPRDI